MFALSLYPLFIFITILYSIVLHIGSIYQTNIKTVNLLSSAFLFDNVLTDKTILGYINHYHFLDYTSYMYYQYASLSVFQQILEE